MNYKKDISTSGIITLKLLKRRFNLFRNVIWFFKGYPMPAPTRAKLNVLKRYSFPNASWVETGTYLGETTIKLSKIASQVISLEPQRDLFEFTQSRFKRIHNIQLVFGTSEAEFENITKRVSSPVCFWLDGHASGDITYQGNSVTPIIHELKMIKKYLPRWKEITIYVDDVREFATANSLNHHGYPSINSLVNWASECNLAWRIEHDIFIATTHFD